MGLAMTGTSTQETMSAITCSIWAGPVEQLAPMAAAPRDSSTMAAVFASVPYNVLPFASKVMVTITGRSQTSLAAISAALASARLIMVSTTSRSTPASRRAVICSL